MASREHPPACFLPRVDVKRSFAKSCVTTGEGWESRVVITTFEMKDGPVKNRIYFFLRESAPRKDEAPQLTQP